MWGKTILAAFAAAGLSASVLMSASASTPSAERWGSFFEESGNQGTLLSPTPISLPAPIVQVASSNSTEYALLSTGAVYAWGLGGDGELGNGRTSASLTTAVRVRFPAGVKIAFLPVDAMPFDTAMAVDTQGNAWGWGRGSSALCLGTTAVVNLTPVELPFTDVTALAGAGDHAVYDADGTVYSCGGNGYGDLGDGSTTSSSIPVAVTGLTGQHVRVLVASYRNAGALLDNGTYMDWGYDGQGQLGDGTFGVASSVPVTVPLPLPVTRVALGGSDPTNGQTLVLLSDGTVRSWGTDTLGQLGDDATTNEASPVVVMPPPGVTYKRLASGGTTSYGLSTSGDVYSFGGGSGGQLGNGQTDPQAQLTPILVASGMSEISATAEAVDTRR